MWSGCGDGPVTRKRAPKCRESPLCGREEDTGAEHFGNINPAVRVLEDAKPDRLADFRYPIPAEEARDQRAARSTSQIAGSSCAAPVRPSRL